MDDTNFYELAVRAARAKGFAWRAGLQDANGFRLVEENPDKPGTWRACKAGSRWSPGHLPNIPDLTDFTTREAVVAMARECSPPQPRAFAPTLLAGEEGWVMAWRVISTSLHTPAWVVWEHAHPTRLEAAVVALETAP